MLDDQFSSDFTPDDVAMIERLRGAPQRNLKPDSFERIRAQLLIEVDTLPRPEPKPQAPVTRALPLTTPVPVIVVVIGVIAVIVLALILMSGQAPSPTPTATLTTTPTATPTPSLTLTPTPGLAPSASLPALVATSNPLPTRTQTTTLTPTSTLTLTPTATETEGAGYQDTIVFIEGPVQAINANSITIFDLKVRLGDLSPTSIRVGDTVRIRARITETGVMIAIEITVIEVIKPGNPDNPGLPPGCKISKKGKVKCSKKTR